MKSSRQIKSTIVATVCLAFCLSVSALAQNVSSTFAQSPNNIGLRDSSDSDKSSDNYQGEYVKPRLKFTVSINEGYDDNVDTTHSNKVESFFTNVYAHLYSQLGTQRTPLTIGIGGGTSYYYNAAANRPFQNTGDFSLSISHNFNRKLSLSFASFTTYQQQANYNLPVSQNANSGPYVYTNNVLTMNYQWSRRWSTTTSLSLYSIIYQDNPQSNVNNRGSVGFSESVNYLLNPSTQLVGTYSADITQFVYGSSRNNFSNTLTGGFNHTFSPRFSVSFNAGASIQTPNQGTTQVAPNVTITMNYAYQRYGSIQWYLNYGLDQSNTYTGNEKHTSGRTGLRLNQAITPKLSFNLGVYYATEHYSDAASPIYGLTKANRTDNTFDIGFGVNYTVTPKLSLTAGYHFTDYLADTSSRDYTRNVFTLGANYTF